MFHKNVLAVDDDKPGIEQPTSSRIWRTISSGQGSNYAKNSNLEFASSNLKRNLKTPLQIQAYLDQNSKIIGRNGEVKELFPGKGKFKDRESYLKFLEIEVKKKVRTHDNQQSLDTPVQLESRSLNWNGKRAAENSNPNWQNLGNSADNPSTDLNPTQPPCL